MLRAGVLGVALSLALATALGGCGTGATPPSPGGAHVIEPGVLQRFALSSSDLPAGYRVVKHSVPADPKQCVRQTSDALADKLDALGMQACATVTFARSSEGAGRTNRPGSAVVLFDTPAHASQALTAVRADLLAAATGTPHSIEVAGLGDEAPRGISLPNDFGALGRFQLFVYVWRRANIVVYGGSSNVLGDFDAASTLALMKQLDARIASYRG